MMTLLEISTFGHSVKKFVEVLMQKLNFFFNILWSSFGIHKVKNDLTIFIKCTFNQKKNKLYQL